MFLGTIICGATTQSAISTVGNVPDTFNKIRVQQTTIDDLYVTKHLLQNFTWELPNNWDYHIILHAFFNNGDMNAGNVIFRNATAIMLKKRIKGTFEWKTIYFREIPEGNTLETLNVKYDDYLEPNHTEVEYAYTAIIEGKETDPILAEALSNFYCYYLIGQYSDVGEQPHYPAMFNISHQMQLNRPSATVVSPGSKYPYVINNGSSKYYGGNFTVTFMPHDEYMLPVPKYSARLRNTLDDFLTDGYPKILKTYDGDIYMAAIIGNVTRNNGQHYQNIGSSWEWAEVGDPNDCGDLYDYGFINTDIGRNGG